MSIGSTLFPPSNREAALVAYLRTFWQVIRSSSWLGGGAALALTATDLAHINLTLLGLAAAAILINAVGSGLIAAGDILKNGLPDAYQAAAVANIPTAIVTQTHFNNGSSIKDSAGVPPADPAAVQAVPIA